jgi:hypothetical protein
VVAAISKENKRNETDSIHFTGTEMVLVAPV